MDSISEDSGFVFSLYGEWFRLRDEKIGAEFPAIYVLMQATVTLNSWTNVYICGNITPHKLIGWDYRKRKSSYERQESRFDIDQEDFTYAVTI